MTNLAAEDTEVVETTEVEVHIAATTIEADEEGIRLVHRLSDRTPQALLHRAMAVSDPPDQVYSRLIPCMGTRHSRYRHHSRIRQHCRLPLPTRYLAQPANSRLG